MLHARVLRSPIAHARIARLDVSPARALLGVAAVLAHQDLPGSDGRVRFVGDRLAVAAAEDAELAQRACEAIKVEFEPLPAIFHPDEALRPDAPALREGGNLAAIERFEAGDVDAGFARAERVLETTYHLDPVPATDLEPHVALAWLDEDRLVVRTTSPSPFGVQRALAAGLGLPAARIRVVPSPAGGPGGKQEALVEDLCALLALRTGRPVRLALTREEELSIGRGAPGLHITVKTGVRDQGLTAIELRAVANVGARTGSIARLVREIGAQALALYRCANRRYEGRAVCTNLPPAGAFRSHADRAGLFALECHLDEVAAALGMDPLDLRRRNLAPETEGEEAGLRAALALGADEIGWSRRSKARAAPSPRRRGLGMALGRHTPAPEDGECAAASLRMNVDGSFNLWLSAPDGGTAGAIGLGAVAARILGLPKAQVVHCPADTDGLPFDPGRPAPAPHLAARAVEKAAHSAHAQLLEAAARVLGVDSALLRAEGGEVRCHDGRALTFGEAFAASLEGPDPRPIAATAFHFAHESPPAFAAAFAEVEVDVETGLVRVLRLVEAVDGGPSPERRIAESRVEANLVLGMGLALYEGMTFDPAGHPAHRSLREAKLAAAPDVPEIRALVAPGGADAGAFGEAAVGEATAAPAAILNAVAHATGVPLRARPARPHRVLAALEEQGAG
jgi:putative selenate reductase molybdopterin-binding subunit